jgi:hypothetical protein
MNDTTIDEGNAIQAEADAREDARREADERDPVGAILRAIETIEREEEAEGMPLPMDSPFWIRLRIASERGTVRNLNPTGRELAQAQAAFWERLVDAGLTSATRLLAMTEAQAHKAFCLCEAHAAELVATLRQPLPPA